MDDVSIVVRLFSPHIPTRLSTLKELDSTSINKEPIRVALNSLAFYSGDLEVRTEAQRLYKQIVSITTDPVS